MCVLICFFPLNLRGYCTISFVITQARVKTLNEHMAVKLGKKSQEYCSLFKHREKEKKIVDHVTGYTNPSGDDSSTLWPDTGLWAPWATGNEWGMTPCSSPQQEMAHPRSHSGVKLEGERRIRHFFKHLLFKGEFCLRKQTQRGRDLFRRLLVRVLTAQGHHRQLSVQKGLVSCLGTYTNFVWTSQVHGEVLHLQFSDIRGCLAHTTNAVGHQKPPWSGLVWFIT